MFTPLHYGSLQPLSQNEDIIGWQLQSAESVIQAKAMKVYVAACNSDTVLIQYADTGTLHNYS